MTVFINTPDDVLEDIDIDDINELRSMLKDDIKNLNIFLSFKENKCVDYNIANNINSLYNDSFVYFYMLSYFGFKYVNLYKEFIVKNYSDIINNFSFSVLYEISLSGLEKFKAINCLAENGNLTSSYLLCRSIYELAVVSRFIYEKGCDCAKAFYDYSEDEKNYYNWAKSFIGKNLNKRKWLKLSDLIENCSDSLDFEKYKKFYDLTSKMIHPSKSAINTLVYDLFTAMDMATFSLLVIMDSFFKIKPNDLLETNKDKYTLSNLFATYIQFLNNHCKNIDLEFDLKKNITLDSMSRFGDLFLHEGKLLKILFIEDKENEEDNEN